ncbi:MAG: phosphotransferase [Clostridia bacterium]|nr:phosphotransferase [Clostridia bacterium]
MQDILCRYGLEDAVIRPVPPHDGGRNRVFILTKGIEKYVLRLSETGDRTEEEYLAETEFVRHLAANGAPVADVLPSRGGKLVERTADGAFASVFRYAPGILLSENSYRYRADAPLSEYFYNTGKTLGKLHALARTYEPRHRRADYFDKYNDRYIDRLIPDDYAPLKEAIGERFEAFRALPRDESVYGLVHFDFSDGNYHVDMETGKITVFDFDNAMYAWYMFDLANLWTHGVGWCRGEDDPTKRRAIMDDYFAAVLAGYRSETDVSDELLQKLPLFVDMVFIENIVDEFECCRRAGTEVDDDDIADAADALIRHIELPILD